MIPNIVTLLSNSSQKIINSGIFGTKFKDFYFCTKLWNKTNSGGIISNMTTNSQIAAQNTQIKHFCSQRQAFLFLHKILQWDKFNSISFKYDIRFSKLLHKTHIFSPKFTNFQFCMKLCILTNSKVLILNMPIGFGLRLEDF